MAESQALNATFFAFQKREKSVLLPATLAYIVLSFLMVGLFAWLNWQGVVDYIAWATSLSASTQAGPNDPNAVAQLTPPASVMGLLPAYFLFLFVSYVLLAAYEAACLRWMIRGETGGVFGLTLGADTWRVYFGYWIWLIIFIVAYFVISIVMFTALGGVIVAAQGNPEAAGLGALIAFGLMIAALLAWIWVSVRLAPAAATSVARRRFAFFDAWKVSKGRFWALFGAFFLLFLLYFVIVGAAFGVFMGTAAIAPESQNPEEALRALASPQTLITGGLLYGVIIVAAFMLYVALYGVNARAVVAAAEEGKIEGVANIGVAQTFE